MHSEMRRNSLLVLVGVNQRPNMGLEIRGGVVLGDHEDAFLDEEIPPRGTVPDDWLPFRKTSIQSIEYPITLPFQPVDFNSQQQ